MATHWAWGFLGLLCRFAFSAEGIFDHAHASNQTTGATAPDGSLQIGQLFAEFFFVLGLHVFHQGFCLRLIQRHGVRLAAGLLHGGCHLLHKLLAVGLGMAKAGE